MLRFGGTGGHEDPSSCECVQARLEGLGLAANGANLGYRFAPVGHGDRSAVPNVPEDLGESRFGVVRRVHEVHRSNITSQTSAIKRWTRMARSRAAGRHGSGGAAPPASTRVAGARSEVPANPTVRGGGEMA